MNTPEQMLTADEKKLQHSLLKESKAEQKHLDHASKDLKHAEKAEGKADKAVDKAAHTHDKLVNKEHKAAKTLNKAAQAHDHALSAEQRAARDITLKQNHHAKLAQDLDMKKTALEDFKTQKETNEHLREVELAQLGQHGASGAGAA